MLLSIISKIIEEKKISKEQLAEKTGIDKKTLLNILSSRENLNKAAFGNVWAILRALDIHPVNAVRLIIDDYVTEEQKIN